MLSSYKYASVFHDANVFLLELLILGTGTVKGDSDFDNV